MDIVIPTLGRAHKQITYDNMPAHWQERTKLVVQPHEAETYIDAGYTNLIVLPAIVNNIADTRHWLLYDAHELTSDVLCMLDDDLKFFRRRSDDPTKFHPGVMGEEDWDAMMLELTVRTCNQAPHVGVSHREGANRNTERYIQASRQMRVLCYHKPTLKKECVAFGRIPVMEDFDTTLQLLRLGYPNLLLNWWVHDQGGSDVEGGCSTFRTPELQAEAAHKLKELHPNFVKVRTIPPKGAWKYERTDVTVYWKRAYESGKRTLCLLD